MKEGRPVLLAFGGAALLMMALPIATVYTMTRSGPSEHGTDGEISRVFVDAEKKGNAGSMSQPVAAIGPLLPKGMPEKTVFQLLAASGFLCATDSDAATCFRSHEMATCKDDWTIRLIFSDNGTIWSTAAKRQATCS